MRGSPSHHLQRTTFIYGWRDRNRDQAKPGTAWSAGGWRCAIALNKELKNEQLRKTKRLELKQEPDYLQVKAALTEATEKRDKEVIQLNLLRNQFSVAKLEARQAIANLESVA